MVHVIGKYIVLGLFGMDASSFRLLKASNAEGLFFVAVFGEEVVEHDHILKRTSLNKMNVSTSRINLLYIIIQDTQCIAYLPHTLSVWECL